EAARFGHRGPALQGHEGSLASVLSDRFQLLALLGRPAFALWLLCWLRRLLGFGLGLGRLGLLGLAGGFLLRLRRCGSGLRSGRSLCSGAFCLPWFFVIVISLLRFARIAVTAGRAPERPPFLTLWRLLGVRLRSTGPWGS